MTKQMDLINSEEYWCYKSKIYHMETGYKGLGVEF